MRCLVIVLAALGTGCGSAPAARPATATYTPAELALDLDRLEAALHEGHPALAKYRTRSEVDSIFRALRQSARRPMTVLELWHTTTLALAAFRDNHTSLVPNSSLFAALYRAPGRALPLALAIVDGRLYVLRNYLATKRPPEGSEIVAVDGVPTPRFLAECARYVPTDGNVALRALRKLERDFDLTCRLAAGLPAERQLIVRAPNGAEDSLTVPTVSWRERLALVLARDPRDTLSLRPAELTLVDDSATAILTMRTFSKQDGFDPGRFIDNAFDRIRVSRARTLIIDVRGNTAGRDTYAARLFAQIARDTFTYYTRRDINKRRFRFLRSTDDWTLNYMTLFIPMTKQRDGRYTLRMAMDKPMRPAQQPFTGRVFLLVDGNSVSTSSEFASVFKARARGTIVGEESGSALGGGTGATVSVVLPNTQLILNVPLMSATIAQRASGTDDLSRGVMPDVAVHASIADRLQRRDVVLDSALALARRQEPAPR